MILLQNVGVLIQISPFESFLTTAEHRAITFALHCNLHAFLMLITEMLGSRLFTITIFHQRSSSARGERGKKQKLFLGRTVIQR